MIWNSRARRVLAVILVVFGALMMWFAPETGAGIALLALGVLLEIVGIALEHRTQK